MFHKSFILPFVFLTTTAFTQTVSAEILIVRKETSVPDAVKSPSVPSVAPANFAASSTVPDAAKSTSVPSIAPANYVSSSSAPKLVSASVATSINDPANKSTLTTTTQKQLMGSVATQEFKAPNYATSVSPVNSNTFNKNIPQYSSSIKLRNPPPYVGCFYTSSRKYGVPVDLLMAIAQTESSFRHDIKGQLGWGADHGLMQINDWWVPRLRKKFNITLTDLYNPCTNIEVASWILAHNFVQFGYSWRAVGAYNAVTEYKRVRYINKVSANLKKLHAGQL